MSPRGVLIAFAIVILGGISALVVRAETLDRPLLGTIGVENVAAVGTLTPGSAGCQGPVELEAGADAATWVLNTRDRPGPPLRLEARAAGSARVIAASRVAPGYGNGPKTVPFVDAPTGQLVDLCLVNDGRTPVDIYGAPGTGTNITNDTSSLSVNGKPVNADAFLTFPAPRGETLADQLPDVPRRASAWLPSPLGEWWVVLLLLGGLVVAVTACALALSQAVRSDAPDAGSVRAGESEA